MLCERMPRCEALCGLLRSFVRMRDECTSDACRRHFPWHFSRVCTVATTIRGVAPKTMTTGEEPRSDRQDVFRCPLVRRAGHGFAAAPVRNAPDPSSDGSGIYAEVTARGRSAHSSFTEPGTTLQLWNPHPCGQGDAMNRSLRADARVPAHAFALAPETRRCTVPFRG